MKGDSLGGFDIWLGYFLDSSGNIQVQGDPRGDPGHAGEIISFIWPGNALVSTQRSFKRWLSISAKTAASIIWTQPVCYNIFNPSRNLLTTLEKQERELTERHFPQLNWFQENLPFIFSSTTLNKWPGRQVWKTAAHAPFLFEFISVLPSRLKSVVRAGNTGGQTICKWHQK